MLFKNVKYVRNYDGDTITFNIPDVHPLLGYEIPIRVRGIDAEELRTKSTKAIQAKEFVHELLSNASNIDLVSPKRGKYFRIVADVMVDGISLADELLKRDLVIPY